MIHWAKKHIIWILILSIILIVLSFGMGLLVRDWPLIKMDYEFKITDVLGIAFSILLAVLIPVYIKHFIDRGNKVNEMVLDEVTRYREHVELIHQRFLSLFQSARISPHNKAELTVLCELLDFKFEILEAILKSRCGNSADSLISELKINQIQFWKSLTSNGIMAISVAAISPTTLIFEGKCHQDVIATVVRINMMVTNL